MKGVELILYGLSAVLATALSVFLAKKPAELIGLIDRPGGRKQHEAPVPLCGGPAMVGAFLVLVFLFQALPSLRHMGLLAGVSLLVLVGFWDDLRDVRAAKRFVAQILIVLVCMEWFDSARIANLGNLFGLGNVHTGYAQIPFTLFCAVCLINAFNLVDGIDGLAGGLAAIAMSYFAAIALVAGKIGSYGLLILLVGGTIGFLLFNLRTPWRKRASAFLGDSGSTALGFVLCWFAIELTQGKTPAIAPITAVWILALPIMDTVNVVLKRISRGHGLFRASRDHLHHALLTAGYTPGQTVSVLLGVAAVMGGLGVAGEYLQVKESMMCLSFIGLFIVYYVATQRFWQERYKQFLKGLRGDETRPSFSEFLNGSPLPVADHRAAYPTPSAPTAAQGSFNRAVSSTVALSTQLDAHSPERHVEARRPSDAGSAISPEPE